MTQLVACLSAGKGTWMHVSKLIQDEDWDKVFLITNEFGRENFKAEKDVIFVVVDFNKGIFTSINDIKNALKGNISNFEVAVNIASGQGKEHMAIIAALIQLGVGFRFVVATKNGVKEI